MDRPRFVFVACLLGVVACGKDQVSSVQPEPTATDSASEGAEGPAQTGATATPEAGGTPWRPTQCADYTFTPKDCTGSPENVECTSSFQLRPDGTVEMAFDDILTRGNYDTTASTVTITVPEMQYTGTFTVDEGGEVLVGEGGQRYQRTDCP